MSNRITQFPELDLTLRAFVASIRPILSNNLIGVYVQGSHAVGAADEHSDCDLVVVIHEPLTAETIAQLATQHELLYEYPGYWPKHLEGSYFPAAQLRRLTPDQPPLVYFDNGSTQLELSDHDNTQVMRWSIREHGIALCGPPIQELVDEVSGDLLKSEIWRLMHSWGAELEKSPACFTDRWCQSYTVISHCRMVHTLATGRVHSKLASARWAMAHFDAEWADFIGRAQANRPGQYLAIYALNHPEDTARTPAFLDYARQVAHQLNQ